MSNMRLADIPTHHTPIPTVEMTPPPYGGTQRDAINSVVGTLVDDICKEIEEMRNLLDVIQQRVLEDAAKTKHVFNLQIEVCSNVKDELRHMRRVVDDIRERGKALHE